jgi:hypothetical protein
LDEMTNVVRVHVPGCLLETRCAGSGPANWWHE